MDVGQGVDVALRVPTTASLILQVQLVGLVDVILLQPECVALPVEVLLLPTVHRVVVG